MSVAETLGKFEHEVLALPLEDLARWLAYIKVKQERIKREQDRQSRVAGSRGKRVTRR